MRRPWPLLALLWAAPTWAASTLDKTPSIDSPTLAGPGTLDFFFSHDFAVTGSKLINSPTFNLEGGVLPWLSIQVQYASSSDINSEVNEAFPALKLQPLAEQRGAPLDLTLRGGYDSAAKSGDGELVAARTFGFLRPYLAARGFSDGYGVGGATFAGSVGLEIRVLPHLAVVGDVGKVLAAEDLDAVKKQLDKVAWSGGIAFDIPYSPHSLSLYATNVNTFTPEGASRGGFESWRFGFQFDVPLRSLARWASIFSPSAPSPSPAPSALGGGTSGAPSAQPSGPAQVQVQIANLHFAPGELKVKRGSTVEFVNHDTVVHTVTAADHRWDSGLIQPGQSWKHTFTAPGRYPYFCAVHPFMRGTVVVE